MLNFVISEKGLGRVSPEYFVIFQEKYFSSYILLADQRSLPNCPYFFRF